MAVAGTDVVLISADAGLTWTAERIENASLIDVEYVGTTPVSLDAEGVLRERTASGDWLARGTAVPGLVRKAAWSGARGVAAGDNGRLWVTLDQGTTWEPKRDETQSQPLAAAWLSPDHCVVAGTNGIVHLHSPEWKPVPGSIRGIVVRAIASAGGDELWAVVGALPGELRRSTDGGASWSTVDMPEGASVSAAVSPLIGDVVIVGADGLCALWQEGDRRWTPLHPTAQGVDWSCAITASEDVVLLGGNDARCARVNLSSK